MAIKVSLNTVTALLTDLLKFGDNTILSVDYLKKDGSKRTMNCRLNVKKYLSKNGQVRKHNPLDKGQLCVAETIIMRNNVKASTKETPYRTINLDSVTKVSMHKGVFKVVEDAK